MLSYKRQIKLKEKAFESIMMFAKKRLAAFSKLTLIKAYF